MLDKYIKIAVWIDNRLYIQKQQKKSDRQRTFNSSNSNKNGKKKPATFTLSGTYTRPIDINAIQQLNQSRLSNMTYYNYSRKGYLKWDCYLPKKKWQPVPRKETVIVEGKERVVEIVAASYTQEDFEDDVECGLQYGDNIIEGTEEASSRRDSLLAGPISDSDTETNLLTTNPKGEYVFDKVFLYLVEEYSLSLRQDQYSTWRIVSQNQRTRSYRRFLQERVRYWRKQAQREQVDVDRLYELFRRNVYKNDILYTSLRRIQVEQRNINQLLYEERSRVVYITEELQELQRELRFVA